MLVAPTQDKGGIYNFIKDYSDAMGWYNFSAEKFLLRVELQFVTKKTK